MQYKNLKDKIFLYPTDTTFGLGCDATDIALVQRINQLKNRSDAKSFVILVENASRLQQLVDVPDLAWDIMDLSEKPVTLIYENPRNLPKELIAEDNTIAVRLTQDLLSKKLITSFNAPIVSTSANISGDPTPQSFSEISQLIKNGVDYIFPECEDFSPKFLGSSIIRLSADGRVKVIRE